MNKNKILFIRLMINILGWSTFLAMIAYMIPIVLTFELNVYNMATIARLFVIAMSELFLFFLSVNSILNKCNKDLNIFRNHIKEMIDLKYILGVRTIYELLIIFFIIIIITFILWLLEADIWIFDKVFYYILLVLYTTINSTNIFKYIKNFKLFNKQLYDEVFK